jgi:hypothetical protein
MSAAVTVFCAVWHQDPNRRALLEGHRENLRRQTVPVEVVYVFDGGDTPPEGLAAQAVVSSEPLTIYHAWNFGIAAARTPLVMNLNLDDRLAPDAVEKMAAELERSGAALVGGDWRICFSRAQTDAVTPCAPVDALPPLSSWPPPPGVPARLGTSRDGNTRGPATLWRMDVHLTLPRYPWRLSDGQTIKAIGDGVFWELLRQRGFPLVRLPLIVGNYYSSPREQAEFRHDSDKEWAAAAAAGVEAI